MKIWGLDIGSTGVKAIEITHNWQGERVTNYWFRPIHLGSQEDFQKEVLQALQEIFPAREKEKRTIILPIPSHWTMVHRGSLPFRDRKKNPQVLKYEAEPLFPLTSDQIVIDYYPLKDKKEGQEVLFFAIRKEELKENLRCCGKRGSIRKALFRRQWPSFP